MTTGDDRGDAAVLAGLLRRTGDGDRDAFCDFYAATSARVHGLVLRVLRDPGYSEETTQEIYLEVWRTAAVFDPSRGSALSWLITMAHRRAIDRVRAEQSASERNDTYGAAQRTSGASVSDDVAEAAIRHDENRAVGDCLGTLSETQRGSVTLAYYGGLTYREVADRLHVALPTIKSRIRDGLKRLRDCLGGEWQ